MNRLYRVDDPPTTLVAYTRKQEGAGHHQRNNQSNSQDWGDAEGSA